MNRFIFMGCFAYRVFHGRWNEERIGYRLFPERWIKERMGLGLKAKDREWT